MSPLVPRLHATAPVERTRSAVAADDEIVPLGRRMMTFAARDRLRTEVEKHLGPPHHRLSPDLWVYFDCESSASEDLARGYDTMVIEFTDARVSSIRLVPRRVVEALIARMAATAEKQRMAATAK